MEANAEQSETGLHTDGKHSEFQYDLPIDKHLQSEKFSIVIQAQSPVDQSSLVLNPSTIICLRLSSQKLTNS